MSFIVSLKKTAVKELRKVPSQDLRRITDKIQGLTHQPRPYGCEKMSGEERYRTRQGDWRIVYSIDDTLKEVTIYKIGHRREVYR